MQKKKKKNWKRIEPGVSERERDAGGTETDTET